MKKRRKYSKIRAPRGLHFVIRKFYEDKKVREVSVELHESKRREYIGAVTLVHCRGRWFETHSNLHHEFRNKKLGALMYSKAIEWALKNKYKVRSSGGSSEDALRVWMGKTIRTHFDIRVKHEKGFKHDPSFDTFYASKKSKKRKRS